MAASDACRVQDLGQVTGGYLTATPAATGQACVRLEVVPQRHSVRGRLER